MLQQPQEQPLPSPNHCTLDLFRVSVIHRTLTWTTGSLTCVCDHSYACLYTLGVLGTYINSSEPAQHFFDSEKNLEAFLMFLTGFEICSWNVKSDALPIEPSRHHPFCFCRGGGGGGGRGGGSGLGERKKKKCTDESASQSVSRTPRGQVKTRGRALHRF